jgi:DNA repair protein RecO (recombination protein O)
MDERALGIILRVRPLTETSLIVQWLTRDHGRIATVAKGARRPKSPLAGKLDLYFLAEFSFHRSRRSELHTLREVALKDTHPDLRTNIDWLQQAAYAVATLELATETESPIPELFQLLEQWLRFLPGQPAQPQSVFAWEMKLLNASGLRPKVNQSPLSIEARQTLEHLFECGWSQVCHREIGPTQIREIHRYLGTLLSDGFGRIPRQRERALAIPFGAVNER